MADRPWQTFNNVGKNYADWQSHQSVRIATNCLLGPKAQVGGIIRKPTQVQNTKIKEKKRSHRDHAANIFVC